MGMTKKRVNRHTCWTVVGSSFLRSVPSLICDNRSREVVSTRFHSMGEHELDIGFALIPFGPLPSVGSGGGGAFISLARSSASF